MIRETRRKKRRISNESNYAGKPSTRHFFPLVRNDEDLAVTHDTRRLDRPHSNDPASLLHASLRFHGTKANRAVTRFERNFRIYSLTKRLSGTHNWTREKKKKRRGEVKRDETRRGTTRQGKARQGEARWKKVNGATLGNTREKYSANTRAGSTSTEYNASRALRVGGVSRVYDRTRSSYIIAMEKGWRKRKRDEE